MKKRYFFLFPLAFLSTQISHAHMENASQPLSLTLDDAMNRDENYSFAVKTAHSEQTNAQRQRNFSITQIGPTLTSSASQNWYDKSNTFSNVNNHGEGNSSSALTVTASQPLIGLIPNSLKIGQAAASLNASKFNLQAARIQARLEGAKAYIQVQQALRTLEAKRAASKSAQELYKEAQTLFDTGSVEKTKIDVLQTKAEAATARLAELFAQKDLDAALIDLNTKIGLQNKEQVSVELEKTSMWEKVNPVLPTGEEALKAALESRPEIFAAQEKFSAAKYNVKQSYFSYLPQVNLFASYSSANNDYANSFPNTTVNQSFYGLSLNWSIWDGGVQAATIAQNVNEQSKSQLENEKMVTTVSQDVKNSLNDLTSAIKSLADAKEAAQSYESAYELATIQYKTGDYSTINLIETQNKMTAAQVALANVRSNLDLSWMELQAALGKLPKVTKENI